MKLKKSWCVYGWIIVCYVVTFCGCTKNLTHPPAQANLGWNIETILFVPFHILSPVGKSETMTCPISGAICTPGVIEEGAADNLSQQLFDYLKDKTDYRLIPPSKGERIRHVIISENLGIPERSLLIEMGKRLQADAVLTGTLYRFRQRLGAALSVESPASVGFGVHLLRVADGRLLWGRQFDETQKSLSEDLFQLGTFVKRGGAWLSAQDLATFGLNKTMTSFPSR